jgi:hypothetical protein
MPKVYNKPLEEIRSMPPEGSLLTALRRRGRFSTIGKEFPSARDAMLLFFNDTANPSNLSVNPDKYLPKTTYVMAGIHPTMGHLPFGTRSMVGEYHPTKDVAYAGASAEDDIADTIGHEATHAQQYRDRAREREWGGSPLMNVEMRRRLKELGFSRLLSDEKAALSKRHHTRIAESFYPQDRYEEIYAMLGGMDAALPAGQRLYDSPEAMKLDAMSPGLIDSYYRQAYAHMPGYSNREPTWKEWLSDLMGK